MVTQVDAKGVPGATARLLASIADHQIIDLTRLLEPGIPTYPTHPKYFQMRWCSMGDPAEMNQLVMGEHTGTHLDAPSHFVPDGPRRKHIHQLPLESFLGRCVKMQFGPFPKTNAMVTYKDIRAWEEANVSVQSDDVVLIDFQWEQYWKQGPEGFGFLEAWPGLSADAAEYFAQKRVKLVGTDCVSLDPGDGGGGKLAAHYTLLPEGVLILENVSNLAKLPPVSFFMALPLKIANGTGSPVRAVAFTPRA
jgi:kynurenine formamidase